MDMLADQLSIASFILHEQLFKGSHPNAKLGEEFAKYCNCYTEEETHKLLKDLIFGERQWMIIGFCRWQKMSSNKIWVRSDQVQYSIQLYCKDSLDKQGMPLIVAEALKHVDDVIVIDDLVSCYEDAGKESLKYILRAYDSYNYLVSAVPGMIGERVLEKNVPDYDPGYKLIRAFFESLGFECVDSYLGEIDDELPMMKTATPLAEVFGSPEKQ